MARGTALSRSVDSCVQQLAREAARTPAEARASLPAAPGFRVDVARFRWLLLGALGVTAGACGGQTGDGPADALGPELGSSGGGGTIIPTDDTPSSADLNPSVESPEPSARLACAASSPMISGGGM